MEKELVYSIPSIYRDDFAYRDIALEVVKRHCV